MDGLVAGWQSAAMANGNEDGIGWRRYGGYAYGGENGGKYDGEEKWREEYRSTPKATCKLNVLVHLMVFLWVFLLSDLSTPSSYYYSMVLPSR